MNKRKTEMFRIISHCFPHLRKCSKDCESAAEEIDVLPPRDSEPWIDMAASAETSLPHDDDEKDTYILRIRRNRRGRRLYMRDNGESHPILTVASVSPH